MKGTGTRSAKGDIHYSPMSSFHRLGCDRMKPKNPQFNWCEDIFVRWHRGTLYFVAVMRTPQGRPPTFEMHAARMEYFRDGKFNLAVPMRRGWNTFKRDILLEECLKEVSESVYLG